MFKFKNPITFLIKESWKFAGNRKKYIILTFILFTIANILSLIEPLIIAKIFNIIQETGVNAESLYDILFYLILFVCIGIGIWLFHGPARVIERLNAFHIKTSFQKFAFNGITQLSAKWHSDTHSGDTIDKINKTSDALEEFSGDTYLIIDSLFKLVGSYIAIIYFNLHASYIVLLFMVIFWFIIYKYDILIMEARREINLKENKISAKF